MKSMSKFFYLNPIYYERSVEILRVLGHSARLRIVRELIAKRPLNVSELQKLVDMPQSTVSQHLTKLRSFKVVSYERKGLEVYYAVNDKDVIGVIKVLGLLK